ncbi:MAG: hypothetical protein KDH18_20365, partial [Rhodoferax sp.]|nr:hypothetical protein [Rhodoferax sp.]
MAIRETAQQALGSQRAAIASQLNLARASIASGRLLPPVKDNARDVLDALLQSDPENADALKLKEALPRVVADALRGAVERNDMDYAVPLADSAAKLYADDAKIAGLVGDVRARQQLQRAERERKAAEQRIAALLLKRPLDSTNAEVAANAIESLRDSAPSDAERFEKQMAEILADDVRGATNLESGKASLAAIRAAASVLKTSKPL